MDITDLLKDLASAVTEAKAKSEAAAMVIASSNSACTEAQTTYDVVVSDAQQKVQAAQAEFQDAKVAVERLQRQFNEMLGLSLGDPRVRISV